MSATDGIAQVNTVATHTALSAWAWGTDFLIVIIVFGALFLFAWNIGKGPFVGLLVSFYAAYGLYKAFPYTDLVPNSIAPTALAAAVLLFLAFTLLSFLILRRVIVSDFLYIGPIGIAILAFLGAGFLLALAYHVFPVREVYAFTPAVDALFAPQQLFFAWFVAPLVGLFFLAR